MRKLRRRDFVKASSAVVAGVATAGQSLFSQPPESGPPTPGTLAPAVVVDSSGVPIRAYGDLCVYDFSPDFQPHNLIQAGNKEPRVKLRPKKSWEIHDCPFGSEIDEV